MLHQRAEKIICPAAAPYAIGELISVDVAKLKRQGRISEDLRLPGYQGRPISLWVLKARTDGPARGTVVLLHPLLTGKSWLFDHGEALALRGWDVVLPDLAAHGFSDGPYVTWGALEKHDIRAVVDRLLSDETITQPIYTGGCSLGAMVALHYAALDDRCRGAVAFAPPIDCRTIARRMLLLESQADFEAALARAAELAGFDPDDASALTAARQMKGPMILVHGFLDTVVPYPWSQRLIEAHQGPEKLITLPVDGHASEFARAGWLADRFDELEALDAADVPNASGESD